MSHKTYISDFKEDPYWDAHKKEKLGSRLVRLKIIKIISL